MAAVEDKLVAATRAGMIERRGQRRRRVWVGAAAASYALDALFLALFAYAGALPGQVAALFALGAALACAVFYTVTALEWNQRLRDPSMILPQSICGVALHFGVVFMAPHIAFPWLLNLMTVLAFATVWMSVAASIALWALCAVVSGVLFYAFSGQIGVPLAGAQQAALVWLLFSVVLGRCVFLSVYSASMRNRLHESRSRLAVTMDQVRELISYDELTKALNRRSLMARLEQEKSGAERAGLPFSVALLDLDHFKAINDTRGHAAGDEVLKAFVRAVHATMRDTDIFGRYGGEEFLMILTDTGADGAQRAMERLRLAVAAFDWAGVAPGAAVTSSIGVATWKAGEEIAPLLSRADAALYRAKDNGRNRVEMA
jgi:diguanylate cyclase (GGDEF)-like protein